MKKSNIWYAIYDNEDNYIIGFNTASAMSTYLGNSKPSLSRILNRKADSRGEINRTPIENDIIDCSQKVYTYTYNIKNFLGENLGTGCSIYKFWEEKIF